VDQNEQYSESSTKRFEWATALQGSGCDGGSARATPTTRDRQEMFSNPLLKALLQDSSIKII
jgi:hypothetical protein